MFRMEMGSSADDPLFRALLAEGNRDEAMSYSATCNEDTRQHNLRVELEDSSFTDPDGGEQVESAGTSNTSDSSITALLRSIKAKKGVKK